MGPVGTTLKHCRVPLPYPAVRCGCYRVQCRACKQLMLVSTAGRPDDPRAVTMICGGTHQ